MITSSSRQESGEAVAAAGDDEAREAFLEAAINVAGSSRGLPEDMDVTSKPFLHKMNVFTKLNELRPENVKFDFIGSPVDAVATKGQQTIGVHTRSGLKTIAALDEKLRKKGLQDKKGRTLDGHLLVVRKKPTHSKLSPAEKSLRSPLGVPVRVIGWQGDDAPARLGDALAELLAETTPDSIA